MRLSIYPPPPPCSFMALSNRLKCFQFVSENDLDRLREDAPHQFGEGLAWSYWCGFIKFILHKNEDGFPCK